MTTGEYLLSKSSLSSGTALAHLLALQTGTGQGTVFAAMFSVSVEQPSLMVTRRAKRQSAESPSVAKFSSCPAQDRSLTITQLQQPVSIHTTQDEITVTSRIKSLK